MATLIIWLSNAMGRDEEGQGLAEYALILALIAIAAVAALVVLSGAINGILTTISNAL